MWPEVEAITDMDLTLRVNMELALTDQVRESDDTDNVQAKIQVISTESQ